MSWDDSSESLEAFRTDKCRTCRGRIEIGQRITRRPGHSTPINSTITKPVQLMTIGHGGEPTELRKDH
jgi:hypothetical protein